MLGMSKTPKASPASPESGRKAAYFARNHAALIASTQVLLGETGWQATIGEVAEHAGVSVSTVYKHFETKELLFEACFIEGWKPFEAWALELAKDVKDPIEQMVIPMRLMLRGGKTHPVLGRIAARNVAETIALFPLFTKTLGLHMRTLVKAGVLDIDHAEMRIMNLKAVLLRILLVQLENPKSKDSDADLALALALPLIGISSKDALEITSRPLPAGASKPR